MLTTLLLFIIILGLLVFVHEFGHFIVAKKMGVAVEEFGFGFPPRMIGVYKVGKKLQFVFKKTPSFSEDAAGALRRTIYSINWIPLGGFVKIKGEDGLDKNDADSFANKAVWKRMAIIAAGVSMNLVLAAVILSIGFGVGIPQALDGAMPGAKIKNRGMQIISVAKKSPAESAGLRAGDEVVSVDGRKMNFKELQSYVTGQIGKDVVYSIKSGGATADKKIKPIILPETGFGGIGVGLVETGIVSYPWHLAIWRGVGETGYLIKEILTAFYTLFRDLIFGKSVSVDLSGPVGIAVLTGRVARLGFAYILQFAAVLSVNLAIVNILPVPALDGGRLLFLAIEKIRRRPVSQKLESAIHNIGFTLLLLLVAVITYRDFIKFGDKFKNLWDNIIR